MIPTLRNSNAHRRVLVSSFCSFRSGLLANGPAVEPSAVCFIHPEFVRAAVLLLWKKKEAGHFGGPFILPLPMPQMA
jgi:hypothetical protein